jgi:phage terminase large subunit
VNLQIPEKFEGFLRPYRYKGAYGGRGGAKSWTIADLLVNIAARQPELVVCAREFQNSIDDSVYRLLEKRIRHFNLPYIFKKTSIECTTTGSEFIFKGLSKMDGASLKSLEGATKLWMEEAQNISHASWENVVPTIRAENSEIWASWNPTIEDAPTQQRLVVNPPPNSYIVQVNWNDNPWFPDVLEQERLHMLQTDPVSYRNVWGGECRVFAEGAFLKDEMAALENAGRIGDVPYNPNKLVYTWWDLSHSASGKGDPNAIAFIQPADGTGFNVIDYWEGNTIGLPKVANDVIKGRDYNYGGHFLPHDAARVNSHTEKSDDELLRDMGLKNVNIVERTTDLWRDMTAVRLVIPMLKIDRKKCAPLIGALKAHRKEQDLKTGLWKFKHDWTSHGISAMRGFSIYRELIKPGIGSTVTYRGGGALSL